jgi:RNA ligase (TIGR02306 family)
MRQLVTIRDVKELLPIHGADRIELARIDGWQCVVKKGDFKVGDPALYLEIDSMVPATDVRFQFLSKGKVQPFFRIKTIRLKGAISQGLLMPLSILTDNEIFRMASGENHSDILGVKLYEPPVPMSGKQKGTFPLHLVPKTDQERIQNMPHVVAGKSFLHFEITEKLDGTSCTIWYNKQAGILALQDQDQIQLKSNPYVGVASRNWEMQREDDNVYSRMLLKYDLVTKLSQLDRNIAIQGEIIGPNIQDNKYQLTEQQFYVFDIYDIDNKVYLPFYERWELTEQLGLNHVPLMMEEAHEHYDWHPHTNERGNELTLENVLALADGKSMINPETMREGLVFKATDGKSSFKAISNEWLLKNE